MKEAIERWLGQHAPLKGLLACGVRYADETVFIPPSPAGFPPGNLEYAFRCMADTFQVLKLNQLPNEYVRWVYQSALLYCLKRSDSIFLGVFISRETEAVDLDGLEKMLGEFSNLEVGGVEGVKP